MVELRYQGMYLPANLILRRPLHTGWIVSQDTGPDEWASHLYVSLKDERSPLNALHAIKTVLKNDDGTYLLRGKAWDAGYVERWPQDWLCGPGDDSLVTALHKMDGWLRQRYTGTFGR